MSFVRAYFDRLLAFLRLRSVAGGLEISDQVLRLTYYDGKNWQMAAVRLAPGIMDKGRIKDSDALVKALTELRLKLPLSKNPKKKVNVIIALSSVKMYTQVFTLPMMEGKNLDSAVDLNLKMISPIDVAQAYVGWEAIGKDDAALRSEVAAAFVEKPIVDEMTRVLYAAGFITVGVESRALAFARIFRQKGAGADVSSAYIVLDIDNSGIDFLVVRKGRLYFEYATEWSDIGDDKGQISISKFQETLSSNLRQVVNFYGQHWPEPLSAIVLSAAMLATEAERAIASATALPVIRLTLEMGQPISSEWLVALGCSLRGNNGSMKDKEINLSGPGAIDMYNSEQMLNFMALWRVLVPSALAVLIVALAITDNFLRVTSTGIQSQTLGVNPAESAAISALQASSTAFDEQVELVRNAESQLSENDRLIGDLSALAAANSVSMNHLSFQGQASPIVFAGSAQNEQQIVAFKNAVQAAPHFGKVDLPLGNIQGGTTAGGYTFTMTFPLSSPYGGATAVNQTGPSVGQRGRPL